jgi:hypothetical protein
MSRDFYMPMQYGKTWFQAAILTEPYKMQLEIFTGIGNTHNKEPYTSNVQRQSTARAQNA